MNNRIEKVYSDAFEDVMDYATPLELDSFKKIDGDSRYNSSRTTANSYDSTIEFKKS